MSEKYTKTPSYCYQCVAGPDLLNVCSVDGVPTHIEPNFSASEIHPGGGRVCVKAYGLIQKSFNPHRITQPMRRTNPNKGPEEDPCFEPISWDEAIQLVGKKISHAKTDGGLDEQGNMKIAVTMGAGGTPAAYMGTFPAFLSTLGPFDMSFGSGQGIKCTHSEHLYGEFWHRGFTVAADTPMCRYLLSFGSNIEVSGGAVGVWRHAHARTDNQLKRVQIEPQLSITAGASSEWVPIRPKTDAAFLFALLNVLIHEIDIKNLDVEFLKSMTSSPYLVATNGFYLRDPDTDKPLIWDSLTQTAVCFDCEGISPSLDGEFIASGIERGADDEFWQYESVSVKTAYSHLKEHIKGYSPEWAGKVCDVPVESIRRVASEFVKQARVGETIEIEGKELPYRPVAITLGRNVNNGWGGYECCWARTLLVTLVGALEVPGGLLGTTIRLNRPIPNRHASVKPMNDGFMEYPFNPTEPEKWEWPAKHRNGYRSLVPLLGPSPWGAALGPTHLAWLFQESPPKGWEVAELPEVWLVYRANPVISGANTKLVSNVVAKFPFTVCFAYTKDETNWMADILLPEATDLESTQLFPIGGIQYTIEQFWKHQGYALRSQAIKPPQGVRDMTDISTELAEAIGELSAYNCAINKGRAGVRLKSSDYDFSLNESIKYDSDEIWEKVCQAASSTMGGEGGLSWFKQNAVNVKPFSQLNWYLYPTIKNQGLRFELPYQERLKRIGKQLANRMNEKGIDWWDDQLKEYQALPVWKDFPSYWEDGLIRAGLALSDFPFWLIGTHSMQYATGSNASIQLMKDVSEVVTGHNGAVMNATRASELGILPGDEIVIASTKDKIVTRVTLVEGVRPDVIVMIGQFGHKVTPIASGLGLPSISSLVDNSLELTDATGSTTDLVRVSIRRVSS